MAVPNPITILPIILKTFKFLTAAIIYNTNPIRTMMNKTKLPTLNAYTMTANQNIISEGKH